MRAKTSSSSRHIPLPNATQLRGSFATMMGMFVSYSSRAAMPASNAPPPVNTMPCSIRSDANRLTRHDSAERDNGDLGRSSTDVHNHVAGRLVNRQTCADRSGHRLFDDVGLSRTGELGGFHDGALLDTGDTRGNTNDHARLCEAALVNAVDEVAQHLLADLEVRDDAVLQGSDGLDVARGATDHALGFGADGERLAVFDVDRDHRRLVQHDAAAADVDQRVRSSEVDRHVTAQKRETTINHKDPLSSDDDALLTYKARTPGMYGATRPEHSRRVTT